MNRPEAADLWGLVDGAENASDGLRQRMKYNEIILSNLDNVSWLSEWLNDERWCDDKQKSTLMMVTLDEDCAIDSLSNELEKRPKMLGAMREIIDLVPCTDSWDCKQISEYVYSVARGEIRLLDFNEMIDLQNYLRRQQGVHVTGHLARLTNVVQLRLELRVEQDDGGMKNYLLEEEGGSNRTGHLLAETISPLVDEDIRSYEFCCSKHPKPADNQFDLDWGGWENKSRSLHAAARGLHEELLRSLTIQCKLDYDEHNCTDDEEKALTCLLNGVNQGEVKPIWPYTYDGDEESVTSGSLEPIVSSYTMSNWEIIIIAKEVAELEIEIIDLLIDPTSSFILGNKKESFVWKEIDGSNLEGNGGFALSAHQKDFDDLVTVYSAAKTSDGRPSGALSQSYDSKWRETLAKGDIDEKEYSEIKEDEDWPDRVPFPGWFNLPESRDWKNKEFDDLETKHEKIRYTSNKVIQEQVCLKCVTSDGEKVNMNACCTGIDENGKNVKMLGIPISKWGVKDRGDVTDDERNLNICKERFWSGYGHLRYKNGEKQGWVKVAERNTSPRPQSGDWVQRRWNCIRSGNINACEKMTEFCEKLGDEELKITSELKVIKPEIQRDENKELISINVEVSDGAAVDRTWNPIPKGVQNNGWFPSLDIHVDYEKAKTTLESLKSSFHYIVIRNDWKPGTEGTRDWVSRDDKRYVIGIVRIDDWIELLNAINEQNREE